MKIYPVAEFSILKQFDKRIFEKIIHVVERNPEVKLLVKKPENVSVWSYSSQEALGGSEGNVLKLKQRLSKDKKITAPVSADYLEISFRSIENYKEDIWEVPFFIGGYELIDDKENNGLLLHSVDLNGRRILIPYTKKTNKNKMSGRTKIISQIMASDLYIGSNLKKIKTFKELQEYVDVFDSIPKIVMDRVNKLPFINLQEFSKLRHLKEVYEEVWSVWDGEEFIVKDPDVDLEDMKSIKLKGSLRADGEIIFDADCDKIYREVQIETDRILNYSGLLKKQDNLKKMIREKRDLAYREIQRRFINDELNKNENPIEKGVSRHNLIKTIKNKNISKDGFSLGEKASRSSANWIEPNIEYYLNGNIRRVENGIAPVKLWILFCSAEYFWVNNGNAKDVFYPTNKFVTQFLKFITNTKRLSSNKSEDILLIEKCNEFLERYPEIKYFQGIKIADLDYEKAASLIRPTWAPSKKKRN